MKSNCIHKRAPIVFVDSQCVVCNGLVKWLLKHDRKEKFSFGALNSESFKALIQEGELTDIPDSVVLFDNNRFYFKSTAVLHILKHLDIGYNILSSIGFLVPAVFRNTIYDWVARNRYSWFGKLESDFCEIPGPELRQRFI